MSTEYTLRCFTCAQAGKPLDERVLDARRMRPSAIWKLVDATPQVEALYETGLFAMSELDDEGYYCRPCPFLIAHRGHRLYVQDEYGRTHDRDGTVRDEDGEVIRG